MPLQWRGEGTKKVNGEKEKREFFFFFSTGEKDGEEEVKQQNSTGARQLGAEGEEEVEH